MVLKVLGLEDEDLRREKQFNDLLSSKRAAGFSIDQYCGPQLQECFGIWWMVKRNFIQHFADQVWKRRT